MILEIILINLEKITKKILCFRFLKSVNSQKKCVECSGKGVKFSYKSVTFTENCKFYQKKEKNVEVFLCDLKMMQ